MLIAFDAWVETLYRNESDILLHTIARHTISVDRYVYTNIYSNAAMLLTLGTTFCLCIGVQTLCSNEWVRRRNTTRVRKMIEQNIFSNPSRNIPE